MGEPMTRGAAHELAVQMFKGALTSEDETITVGTSAGEVAPNDPERVLLLLVNLGTTSIFIAPTTEVSSSRGITLQADGGALILKAGEDGDLVSRELHGIANAANQSLYRVVIRRFVLADLQRAGVMPRG